MTTRNEAALQQLPARIGDGDLTIGNALMQTYAWTSKEALAFTNAANAAAKADGAREAVERIRARLEGMAAADRAEPPVSGYLDECVYGIMPRILDEEATR